MKHPMQPIVWAEDKVIRFKQNAIVDYLVKSGKADLNEIATMPFSREDREQFWQLIGYSVSGYGDLSFVSKATIAKADAIAAKMWAGRKTADKKPRHAKK